MKESLSSEESEIDIGSVEVDGIDNTPLLNMRHDILTDDLAVFTDSDCSSSEDSDVDVDDSTDIDKKVPQKYDNRDRDKVFSFQDYDIKTISDRNSPMNKSKLRKPNDEFIDCFSSDGRNIDTVDDELNDTKTLRNVSAADNTDMLQIERSHRLEDREKSMNSFSAPEDILDKRASASRSKERISDTKQIQKQSDHRPFKKYTIDSREKDNDKNARNYKHTEMSEIRRGRSNYERQENLEVKERRRKRKKVKRDKKDRGFYHRKGHHTTRVNHELKHYKQIHRDWSHSSKKHRPLDAKEKHSYAIAHSNPSSESKAAKNGNGTSGEICRNKNENLNLDCVKTNKCHRYTEDQSKNTSCSTKTTIGSNSEPSAAVPCYKQHSIPCSQLSTSSCKTGVVVKQETGSHEKDQTQQHGNVNVVNCPDDNVRDNKLPKGETIIPNSDYDMNKFEKKEILKTWETPSKNVDLKKLNPINEHKVVKYAAVTGVPKSEAAMRMSDSDSSATKAKSNEIIKTESGYAGYTGLVELAGCTNYSPFRNFPTNHNPSIQTDSVSDCPRLPVNASTASQVMTLLLNGIPQNNPLHSLFNIPLPKTIPNVNTGCSTDAPMDTVSNPNNGVNGANSLKEAFEPPKIIPTESNYPLSAACHVSAERSIFRTPEIIDLPVSCVQNIYHCFPKHVIDKCSPYDPRTKRCQVFASEHEEKIPILRNDCSHAKKTDIVSAIIQSSQIPLAEKMKRNNVVPFQNNTKTFIQTKKNKCKPTMDNSVASVKPTAHGIGLNTPGRNNISNGISHLNSVNKNTIISYLKEFCEIEHPCSPVLSYKESDNDDDTDDDDDDTDDDDNDIGDEHDDKDDDGKDDAKQDSYQGNDYVGMNKEKPDFPLNHEFKDIITCGILPKPKDGNEKNTDNVQTAHECLSDDDFFSFLNFTSNNPYGNEDSDPLMIRDGSESVTPEDDDAPMQDEMSSPVLLNACDRVYHIKRDTDIERTTNTFYNAQPCPSWYSHGTDEDIGGRHQICYQQSSRRSNNPRNSNTDLLGQAMYNAGISDHTIDTLLNSNSAVENSFCEDDLYSEFCTEVSEGNITAMATSITTTTVSDSCLPSTSSFIQRQFSASQTDFTDDEINSLLYENSRLLDIYCNQLGTLSSADTQSTCEDQSPEPRLLPITNEEESSEQQPEECPDCPSTAWSSSQRRHEDCIHRSTMGERTAKGFNPLTVDWESLNFIDGVADARKLETKNALSTLEEEKRDIEAQGTKKDIARSDENQGECSHEVGSLASARDHDQHDYDFEFNIGGVILPGSSKERRSKRIRTLEEVKNFDKKYVVPRIVVDTELTIPKRRKSSTLSSTRNKRRVKASPSKELVSDALEVSDKDNDIANTKEISKNSQNTRRSLRSSTQSRNQSSIGFDDDMADGPMTSMTTTKKRGRGAKRSSYLKKEIKNDEDEGETYFLPDDVKRDLHGNGIPDIKTNATFTAQIFRATIRPTAIIDGTQKAHKYRLIQRPKRQRRYYVFRARPDPAHPPELQHQQQDEGTCCNNNADTNQVGESSQTSTAKLNEIDVKTMKRNLRQKDKDLEKYYSRCRRPEKSSFVNSMIHKTSVNNDPPIILDSKISVPCDHDPSPTLPLGDDLKLNLSLDDDSQIGSEINTPSEPDLPPCILRFVTRMMGGYGDYFCDSTDTTSREKRLRMCDSYLRRHGIKTESLHQLIRKASDRSNGNIPEDKSTEPSSSKSTSETTKMTDTDNFYQRPGKSQSDISHTRMQRANDGNDARSVPDTSFCKKSRAQKDEENEISTIDGRKSSHFTLPEIKERRTSQDIPRGRKPLPKQNQPINGGDAAKGTNNSVVGGDESKNLALKFPKLDDVNSPSRTCYSEYAVGRISSPRKHHFSGNNTADVYIEGNENTDLSARKEKSGSNNITRLRDGVIPDNEEDDYGVEYSSSEESIFKSTERKSYVQNQVMCELELPTGFEGVDFDGPMSSRSLKSGSETSKTQHDELIASLTRDINVAEMLDDIETEQTTPEQIATDSRTYDKEKYFGRAEFGNGDVHFSDKVYEDEEKDDADVNTMVNTNNESDDFCRNPSSGAKSDASILVDNEPRAPNSKDKRTDSNDETTPLTSLEKIAKEAETDFNSTIAGSLLNLETSSDCRGSDIDMRSFCRNIYKKPNITYMSPKRFGMFQRFPYSTNLSTIEEEGDNADDGNDKAEHFVNDPEIN